MSSGQRPDCIGMFGFGFECEECDWAIKCRKLDESIESAVTRKGSHVRLTGKYKEKKYKPRTRR